MFWGLIMEPKRRYYQEVTRPFHISMASMDLSACTKEPVQLMVQFQNRNYLLCTLQKGGALQVPLDLNFEAGDEVSFTINGQSHVHLSGYHVEDEYEDIDEEDEGSASDMEEEKEVEDDVEEPDLSLTNIVYGKRKQSKATTNLTPAAKRSKTLELLADADGSDDDDEDVTFSDLEEEVSDDEAQTTIDSIDDDGLEGDSDEDDSDLDLEEGDDEEEEAVDEGEQEEGEDDSDEEIEKQMVEKKLSKKEKQKKQAANQSQQQKSPEKQNKQKEQKQQQQQQQQPQVNGTPTSEKKKKKKNKRKQDQNESVATDLNVSTKEIKQEKTKTPKSEKKQQKQNSSPQKSIIVDRGVTIEEIVVGGGNPAKNGKLAHVYYEGRLKNSKKTFDNCLKGPPFKFRLGSAEVIKGWDVGVAGMKVGGKRRITVPAQMGYGSQGNKPVIPPNATLVFDIELRNVT